MADKLFAKSARPWRKAQADKLYCPPMPVVKDTGTPTIKHGRYSNLYSIRGAMPRGLNLEISGAPKPKRFARWGVKG